MWGHFRAALYIRSVRSCSQPIPPLKVVAGAELTGPSLNPYQASDELKHLVHLCSCPWPRLSSLTSVQAPGLSLSLTLPQSLLLSPPRVLLGTSSLSSTRPRSILLCSGWGHYSGPSPLPWSGDCSLVLPWRRRLRNPAGPRRQLPGRQSRGRPRLLSRVRDNGAFIHFAKHIAHNLSSVHSFSSTYLVLHLPVSQSAVPGLCLIVAPSPGGPWRLSATWFSKRAIVPPC